MARKMYSTMIDNFQYGIAWMFDKVSVQKGPVLVRRRGDSGPVVAILITKGMFLRMEDMLSDFGVYLDSTYLSVTEVRTNSHRLLRELNDGTWDAIVVTSRGKEVGVMLSPSLVCPFGVSCPGQARRFDWTVV